VNVQVPTDIPTGILILQVNSPGGKSADYEVVVNAIEPGLYAPQSYKINGLQYVAGFDNNNNGALALPANSVAGVDTQPASPNDVITLYGLGFGPVAPAVPAGQVSQGLTSLPSFSISIGGVEAQVQYAGLAPNYVGLYQFNVVVPSIPANNAAPVTFTVNGTAGTQILYMAVN
jgi:uncharacterized protein (TIGR03437 family)